MTYKSAFYGTLILKVMHFQLWTSWYVVTHDLIVACQQKFMREQMTNYQEIWVERLLFNDIISLNVEFLPILLLTSTFFSFRD